MQHPNTHYYVTLEKWEKPLYDYSDIVNFVDYIDHAEEKFSPLTLQNMIEIDLWIETTDVNWDNFSKKHIRDLQHFVKTYSALWMPKWFDSQTTEANRVIWFRDWLWEYLSCLQSFDDIDDTLWTKTVDFDKWYISTYKKISNESVERDIEIRSLCASIRDDEHLPRAEKYDKIEKLVQHYYYHATDFTTKQIKRLHELKIHERREKLSSWKKIVLLAWITTLLLLSQPRQQNEQWIYTTPITPEQLFENTENNEIINDYISDQLVQEEQANKQDELEQWWSKNEETYSQTWKPSQAISDTMNVQAPSLSEKVVNAVREVFTAPESLKQTPLKPIQSTSNDRERIMTKENIGNFILMKDPIANVYFRKVKAGQTLGEVHRALQQDERFAYLKNDSYDPRQWWNVFGWNIKAWDLKPWMLIPVPLDRTETIITQKELISAGMDAIDNMKEHTTYGDFMKTLENNLGRNHLMKILIVFADKESNMWRTQLFRFEAHHGAYSNSVYHILNEWPWKRALENLWFTEADVMSDPMKASQWFRAYWYEKFEDLKNNKNFGKRYDNPSKFFAKKNLKTCGKLYNGKASYGTELKERWKELFK